AMTTGKTTRQPKLKRLASLLRWIRSRWSSPISRPALTPPSLPAKARTALDWSRFTICRNRNFIGKIGRPSSWLHVGVRAFRRLVGVEIWRPPARPFSGSGIDAVVALLSRDVSLGADRAPRLQRVFPSVRKVTTVLLMASG